MIESVYWKNDLSKHVDILIMLQKNKSKNFSVEEVVEVEKETFLSFCIVRKLIEANKITNKSKNKLITIVAHERAQSSMNLINRSLIHEHYNLESGNEIKKDIKFISNQFMHSISIYFVKGEDFSYFYVCSDFEIKDHIYLISVENVIEIFKLIIDDHISSVTYKVNKDKNDYILSID